MLRLTHCVIKKGSVSQKLDFSVMHIGDLGFYDCLFSVIRKGGARFACHSIWNRFHIFIWLHHLRSETLWNLWNVFQVKGIQKLVWSDVVQMDNTLGFPEQPGSPSHCQKRILEGDEWALQSYHKQIERCYTTRMDCGSFFPQTLLQWWFVLENNSSMELSWWNCFELQTKRQRSVDTCTEMCPRSPM